MKSDLIDQLNAFIQPSIVRISVVEVPAAVIPPDGEPEQPLPLIAEADFERIKAAWNSITDAPLQIFHHVASTEKPVQNAAKRRLDATLGCLTAAGIRFKATVYGDLEDHMPAFAELIFNQLIYKSNSTGLRRRTALLLGDATLTEVTQPLADDLAMIAYGGLLIVPNGPTVRARSDRWTPILAQMVKDAPPSQSPAEQPVGPAALPLSA